MTHPASQLDNVVHERTRLGILAVLSEVARADFSYLRDKLNLSDGNLSRHLQVLEEAGYVKIEKTFEGKRTRTWASPTKSGRAAFKAETNALLEIIKGSAA